MSFTLRIKMPSPQPECSPESFAEQLIVSRGLEKDFLLGAKGLGQLTAPFSLKGIEEACARLLQAMRNNEVIGILSDHDCDGQTACAVLYSALTEVFAYPASHIVCFIGHRTEEGYGITDKLTERILSAPQLPAVMVTADCGSSDERNIAILKAHGIDLIVTDHHQIPPAGPPLSAYTTINPQQEGCAFPDKNIAGCAVAWLVMCALRARMMEERAALQSRLASPHQGSPLPSSLPSMAPYLDFVAIGTLSDCVSLTKSLNNRIFLRYGLERIRQGKRPCWRVLKSVYNDTIDCEFLTFKVIPLINADGRLSNALGGVGFLISQDMVTAQEQLAILMETNEHRKHLQKIQLARAHALVEPHAVAQILNLSVEGHHGIHGVTASRISEEQGQMTVIFSQIDSPADNPILSGSARGLEGQSLKVVLDRVAQSDHTLMLRYGGHAQAAGLSLYASKFLVFKAKFLEAYQELYNPSRKGAYGSIACDAILPGAFILNKDWLQKMEALLEPFGKDFKKPMIGVYGSVVEGRALGAEKNHLQLMLQIEGGPLKTMLFFCKEAKELLSSLQNSAQGEKRLFIGELSFERYRQTEQYVLLLKGIFSPHSQVWSTNQSLGVEAKLELAPHHESHPELLESKVSPEDSQPQAPEGKALKTHESTLHKKTLLKTQNLARKSPSKAKTQNTASLTIEP